METLCKNCGGVVSVTECPYCGKRVKEEMNTNIYFGLGCIAGFVVGLLLGVVIGVVV
jgi:hypothetical protein